MREVSRMLAAALAACAAFLALFFALRWHIAVCALLAVGVYFGLYFLLKPVRRIAGIAVEDLASACLIYQKAKEQGIGLEVEL